MRAAGVSCTLGKVRVQEGLGEDEEVARQTMSRDAASASPRYDCAATNAAWRGVRIPEGRYTSWYATPRQTDRVGCEKRRTQAHCAAATEWREAQDDGGLFARATRLLPDFAKFDLPSSISLSLPLLRLFAL